MPTFEHNQWGDMESPLFQNFPVPVLACEPPEGKILAVNSAAVARYGYSSDQLRSMKLDDLTAKDSAPGENGVEPSRNDLSLVCHRTRSGEEFMAGLHFSACRHGEREVLLVAVTEQMRCKDMAERLRYSEELRRMLIEEYPFGIFRINLETDRLDLANAAFVEATGYSLAELRVLPGRNLYSPPEDRTRFLAQLLAAGKVKDFPTRYVTQRGETRSVLLSGNLYMHPGTRVRYALGYLLDVTRQRELEEQVSHSHRMEAVGRLAGGVAHDFNNISLSISLACEAALQRPLPAEVQSKLMDIMHETTRAADITRQLLAFSRRQVLQPRVVDLNDSLRQAVPLLRRALGLDVHLEMHLDDAIERVFIDPEQLLLALMHMADNAREAMPRGGSLHLSTARGGEGTTVLTVTDTGIGMDEVTRSHIFEPFFTTKPGMPATGLGLSTVHGIVVQSRGRITCTSRPGKGTSFRIELPSALQVEPAVADDPAPVKQNGVRLLLAEDDRVVNKNLKHALEQSGYEVDAAENGEQALELFDPQRHHLLVTDIMMPLMNGVELTRCVRQRHPELPVLLISGFSAESRVLQELPGGKTAFLQKPFPVKKLIEVLRQLVTDASAG